MSALLDGLNSAQRAAVTSTAPVILTLAGAGSGKTRVLSHRVAYLHQEKRVGTVNVLCLTFSRLAAKEMKERVMKLVGEAQGKKLWAGTFHAFCAGVLTRWGHKLGIDPGYTIYDQEDRENILETIIKDLGGRTKLKKVLDRFENCLNIEEEKVKYPEECRVLVEYGYRLRQNNAVDLDRLIDLVNRLWTLYPEALDEYRRNYTHVFIDEFQDTSDDQMKMIDLLFPQNLFVVGDDYQSLYSWRKARVEYIINFPSAYPACETFKLEDNYRSTSQIVASANTLIKHNTQQTEKKLIAHKDGPPIEVHCARDEMQEALIIGKIIQGLKEDPASIAVLARTNRLIDMILPVLEGMGIPVQRVTGGDDTFKAPGVRGILDWMNLVHNKRDTMTVKKCLSFLVKQYHSSDLQMKELELEAMQKDLTLFQAMELHQHDDLYFVKTLIEKIHEIESEINSGGAFAPSHCFQIVDRCLGTSENYKCAGLENRIKDIQKAIKAMEIWERSKSALGESCSTQAFLKWLRYRDIQEKMFEEKQAVKLMTVHAAKGLEFDTVILAGMNQGVFPSRRSEKENPEEERRVCYVAITRPKNRLIITRSETMKDFRGSPVVAEESQYLREMGIA